MYQKKDLLVYELEQAVYLNCVPKAREGSLEDKVQSSQYCKGSLQTLSQACLASALVTKQKSIVLAMLNSQTNKQKQTKSPTFVNSCDFLVSCSSFFSEWQALVLPNCGVCYSSSPGPAQLCTITAYHLVLKLSYQPGLLQAPIHLWQLSCRSAKQVLVTGLRELI